MKVIIDTNIWISFIISAKLDELVHLIIDNDITVYTLAALEDELTEVLSREKFIKYLNLPVLEYVLFQKELCIAINILSLFQDSPDPKDNFLFDMAFQSDATHIVTGDKKLLDIQSINSIQLISLSNFKMLFQ